MQYVSTRGTAPVLSFEDALLTGLAAARTWTSAAALGADVSGAGDLGWAWGAWTDDDGRGHYLRVWTRRADGAWHLVLEVRQPVPAEVLQ